MGTKTLQAKKNIKSKPSSSFLGDTKAELKKVEWPTKKSVINSSFIILIIMIFFTTFISFVDMGLSKLLLMLKGINT